MIKAERDFIQILRKAIAQPFKLEEPVDWLGVWNLAKRHHLEAMIYLADTEAVPDELKDKMDQKYGGFKAEPSFRTITYKL